MNRMRSMRRWLAVPALVLAVVMVMAGCSGGGGGGGSSKPLVIGASLPLSGDFSQPGEASQRGYVIWQELVNSGGGLLKRQVQLKIVDDASDQNTVVSDYTRLISQDKVNLLLGSFSSLLNIPASAVAERSRMLYVCPSCGSPKMFDRVFFKKISAYAVPSVLEVDVFASYLAPLAGGQRR